MTTPTRITGPTHELVAAYRRAKSNREQIFAKHLPTANAILSHHHTHGRSDASIYRINFQRTDGPNHWDEVLTWDYVGPAEDHGDLRGHAGYITVRTGNRRVIQALYPSTDDDSVYLGLIKAAYAAAPQVVLILTIGAASGAIEWDTGETIQQAATRIALDGAWAIRDESGYNHTPERVLDAVRESLGQQRPMVDFARTYLDYRDMVLSDLERVDISLGDPLLNSQEVCDRAGILPSTLRAYVARQEAPSADVDQGTRNPRWHEATVTAWLASR